MYLLSILATCVNTKWWVGYVASIVPGILDSLLEPFWRFLDNFVLFFNHQKSSRRHQEVIKKRLRHRQEGPRRRQEVTRQCKIVTKFLNIFANFLVFPNRLRFVKKYQEVPRSCSRSHEEVLRLQVWHTSCSNSYSGTGALDSSREWRHWKLRRISPNSPEVLVFSRPSNEYILYALFAFSGAYVTKVLHNCHLQAPSVVVIYNLCIIMCNFPWIDFMSHAVCII